MLNSSSVHTLIASITRGLFLVVGTILCGCTGTYEEKTIALNDYNIQAGFELRMVASEPLVEAPVAISFDDQGRIWVAEMASYMSDMEGTNENSPIGKIKILEDRDKDGVIDHTKIFLDSLVLPRALAHVYGGLLYAEPPFLYFVDIVNDMPQNKIVVDSLYAAEGNPEHQPNGLLLNIDNWIYNAKSNFRYRRVNDVWVKEPTSFRGQWGIAKDNFGRLYYNTNATQLIGDYLLPNRITRNKFVQPEYAVNQVLTKDQRVYPLQPTLVNRGYSKGVLDADSLLVHVTASCGPLVYRGGAFPLDYQQDVFVCVPEANLIKRNKLTFYGDIVSAKQAYQGEEFLASLDKGFRPVSLANGPDGSMYVVDMHRGVIGHHAYLSPYFKKKAKELQMDTLVAYGRILKITGAGATKPFDENVLSKQNLIAALSHSNGWIRDKAQHKLIQNIGPEEIKLLKAIVLSEGKSTARIHALYVLEGSGALGFEFLNRVAKHKDSQLVAHALVLLERYVSSENMTKALALFGSLLKREDRTVNLYLATTLGPWAHSSREDFFPLIVNLYRKNVHNAIVLEALLSGLSGNEEPLLEYVIPLEDTSLALLIAGLTQVVQNKKDNRKNLIYSRVSLSEDDRTKGARLFRQICAACHGINGDGMEGLAPPLIRSEHVSASAERLTLIMLHGLTGPVHVNGKRYELNQAMPGILANEALSDEDIADIVSYVTNAFSDKPNGVTPERVKELRAMKPKSGAEYTEEELLQLN